MKIIKDWLIAIRICRKYNIKWNPIHNLKNAECLYSFGNYEKVISINPFYPKFIDSFVHEVGHLRRWDKIYKRCKVNKINREPINLFHTLTDCILKEEYMAWKYSKRFLKGRFDRPRAKTMFKSYYPVARTGLVENMVKATDTYYSFDRKI